MEGVGRSVFPALGTTAELLTFPAAAMAKGLEVLVAELGAFDQACSRFREDSDLVALNRVAGRWVDVGPLLFDAVQVALVAAQQTNGAVDPTVGAALRQIGYDCDFVLVPPWGPPLQVAQAPVAGWRQVEVDELRRRVRVPATVQIDLGATAKALAADRAAERIASETGAGALVSLGGDLSATGCGPPGGWLVRVSDDHRGPITEPGQTITIDSGGLATSSTVARSWRRGAQTLHHIVDPRTGCSARGPWRTVSVTASTCVGANTASTAALAYGQGALDWLERTRLPCRLVAQDGHVTRLSSWPEEAA